MTEGGTSAPPRWTDTIQVDDRWRAIIDRAMAPVAADRFADAKSLAAAVHALADTNSGTVAKAPKTA
ncbi:MAG: hypothetical protein HYV09_19670 [Deltaproteobacteria bacterium]|nr:hypothetical protein [Deltaproteobacteria bacterium]